MRATAVSPAAAVVATRSGQEPTLMVPACTAPPGPRATGADSPAQRDQETRQVGLEGPRRVPPLCCQHVGAVWMPTSPGAARARSAALACASPCASAALAQPAQRAVAPPHARARCQHVPTKCGEQREAPSQSARQSFSKAGAATDPTTPDQSGCLPVRRLSSTALSPCMTSPSRGTDSPGGTCLRNKGEGMAAKGSWGNSPNASRHPYY